MGGKDQGFPDGMVPLEQEPFNFACHPEISCFTTCCKNVDLTLYPYDIILLKNGLKLDSEEFLRTHTFLVKGDNLYFPTVKLKLADDVEISCPFLDKSGCMVYENRPSACRTYPLERAVARSSIRAGLPEEYYFMTNHPYCHGHREERLFTVQSWIRNQKLFDCNTMNGLWAEVDTLIATNPWKGEGAAGEKQQLAFLACYNVDGFRRFCRHHGLLKKFQLSKDMKRRIDREDSEMLKFAFEWLKLLLAGRSSLVRK